VIKDTGTHCFLVSEAVSERIKLVSRGGCFEGNTLISTFIIINYVEITIISIKQVLTGKINTVCAKTIV